MNLFTHHVYIHHTSVCILPLHLTAYVIVNGSSLRVTLKKCLMGSPKPPTC